MDRVPEPELMDDPAQARAYAGADFSAPHDQFVRLFRERVGECAGRVLDLGCGPADVTLRFARANPRCAIDGVDGARAMLALGGQAVAAAGMAGRVRLIHGYLPNAALPLHHYGTIISNSLLHHLADPAVLWRTIAAHGAPGAAVFVMDLLRPSGRAAAAALVDAYSADEPEILRHDLFRSLCAAYRPDEVRAQLAGAGLASLRVEVVSDRHLLVSGVLPS